MVHTHSNGTTHDHNNNHDDTRIYNPPARKQSWVPGLLMIPLFLLLGMGALGMWNRLSDPAANPNGTAVRDNNTTGRTGDNSGTTFGIGGAPATTVSPSLSPTRKPSVSPTMSVSPSPSVSPTSRLMNRNNAEIGIGGAPGETDEDTSDDTMPYTPPDTGKGGSQ